MLSVAEQSRQSLVDATYLRYTFNFYFCFSSFESRQLRSTTVTTQLHRDFSY